MYIGDNGTCIIPDIFLAENTLFLSMSVYFCCLFSYWGVCIIKPKAFLSLYLMW